MVACATVSFDSRSFKDGRCAALVAQWRCASMAPAGSGTVSRRGTTHGGGRES